MQLKPLIIDRLHEASVGKKMLKVLLDHAVFTEKNILFIRLFIKINDYVGILSELNGSFALTALINYSEVLVTQKTRERPRFI